MINVCVQHFDRYTKEQANKCEYPVSGSVRFRPEQISAVTDSVPEHWRPDRTITDLNNNNRNLLSLTMSFMCQHVALV